jgi:riboflavin transporter FmnP
MYIRSTTITIAGGGIFSAISILFALTITPIVPRVPGWGIALIDPISIVWVLCFLLFGLIAGIICASAGFIGLFFVDPFIPWGPIFKLLATLPIIIIPYLVLISKSGEKKQAEYGARFKSGQFYTLATIPGIMTRCLVMVITNFLFLPIIFGPGVIDSLGGPLVVSLVIIIINIEQSVWDLLIPWIIVYPTGIYEMYRFW